MNFIKFQSELPVNKTEDGINEPRAESGIASQARLVRLPRLASAGDTMEIKPGVQASLFGFLSV